MRDVPHPLSPAGLDGVRLRAHRQLLDRRGRAAHSRLRGQGAPEGRHASRASSARCTSIATSAQVVRMTFSFTRAAFLDKALEDLSIVLENRLVGGRFWLPSRQEIEIRRDGDVARLSRSRHHPRPLGDRRLPVQPSDSPPQIFTGPGDRAGAAGGARQRYQWTGRILDSLPPDVRAVTEPDIAARAGRGARARARAGAGARAGRDALGAQHLGLRRASTASKGSRSAPDCRKQFGARRRRATCAARYGIDDKRSRAALELSRGDADVASTSRCSRCATSAMSATSPSGRASVNRSRRRSSRSDYTDPYLVRAVGVGVDVRDVRSGFDCDSTAAYRMAVARSPFTPTPVAGTFEPTVRCRATCARRDRRSTSTRPPSLWLVGTELSRARARCAVASRRIGRADAGATASRDRRRRCAARSSPSSSGRSATTRLVTSTTVAGVAAQTRSIAPQRLSSSTSAGPSRRPATTTTRCVADVGVTRARRAAAAGAVPCRSRSAGSAACPAHGSFAPYVHVAAHRTAAGRVHVERRLAPDRVVVGGRRGCIRRSARPICMPFDSCGSTSRAASARGRAMDVQRRRQPRVLEHPLSVRARAASARDEYAMPQSNAMTRSFCVSAMRDAVRTR